MKLNDDTLMVLNTCVDMKTNLICDNLKNVLLNCFFASNYLREKGPNNELTLFFLEILRKVSRSAANKALDAAPNSIEKKVEPLWATEERFDEILATLTGGTYRDHVKHSKRNFWLGMLLSKIKNNWDWEPAKNENFENSWYLIARFHDFCYIMQNIGNLVKGVEGEIVETFKDMNFSMKIDINLGSHIMTKKHLKLLRYINPREDTDSFITNTSFLEQLERKKHSVLSALFIIDFLREKNLIPQTFSEEDLKKIARAIALHADSLTQAVLRPKEDYYAALLILVDEVQEWGRVGYEMDSFAAQEIEVNNLNVEIEEIPKISSFIDEILGDSGKHRLPKLKFGLEEKFTNFLVVKKADDEVEIVVLVDIQNDQKFRQLVKKKLGAEKEQLILEHARAKARAVISKLSAFGDSIGLKAVQLSPEDIISSRSEKTINLEMPVIRKCKLFPINADRTALPNLLVFILNALSPFKRKKASEVTLMSQQNKAIEFNIPGLRDSDISHKKRNLYRINALGWDWGITIVSEPAHGGGREHIFPIENVDDL